MLSSAAKAAFLIATGIALFLFAVASMPARVLRAVSGGLVWRRSDLAFAAFVSLSVGLLAIIAAAM